MIEDLKSIKERLQLLQQKTGKPSYQKDAEHVDQLIELTKVELEKMDALNRLKDVDKTDVDKIEEIVLEILDNVPIITQEIKDMLAPYHEIIRDMKTKNKAEAQRMVDSLKML